MCFCCCIFNMLLMLWLYTDKLIDWDNQDVRLTVFKKQTHTPTVKLFTPGERVLRRQSMCHQNLPVCSSMTWLGRASSLKHTKSTQVSYDVMTTTPLRNAQALSSSLSSPSSIKSSQLCHFSLGCEVFIWHRQHKYMPLFPIVPNA